MTAGYVFQSIVIIIGTLSLCLFVLWCFGGVSIDIAFPGSKRITNKERADIAEKLLASAIAKQIYVYYQKDIGPIFLQGDVADQNRCDLVTARDIKIWLKGALKTKYVGIEVEEPVGVKQDVDKR